MIRDITIGQYYPGAESDPQTGSACEDCLHTDLFGFFICAEQCAWICIGICISCVHDSRF